MSSCGPVFKGFGSVTLSNDIDDYYYYVRATIVCLKAMKTGDTATDSHMPESDVSIALLPPAT